MYDSLTCIWNEMIHQKIYDLSIVKFKDKGQLKVTYSWKDQKHPESPYLEMVY